MLPPLLLLLLLLVLPVRARGIEGGNVHAIIRRSKNGEKEGGRMDEMNVSLLRLSLFLISHLPLSLSLSSSFVSNLDSALFSRAPFESYAPKGSGRERQ